MMQKILLTSLEQLQTALESSMRCCFWLGVSKRGTHFENNLRIPKDLQSPKTILWTFVMFSGTTADFERPERSASSVFVQPRLNSAYQSMIVDFSGEESL